MSILGKLTKAAVRTALLPVTIAVDAVMIVPDSCDNDPKRNNFMNRTCANLKGIAEDVEDATNEKDLL